MNALRQNLYLTENPFSGKTYFLQSIPGLRDEPLKVRSVGGEESVPVPEGHEQRGAQLGPVQDPLRRKVKLQRHVDRRRLGLDYFDSVRRSRSS